MDATEDAVMITAAVSGALSLLAMCIDPGDEVVIFDPSFVGYRQLVLLYGGVPVVVPLARDFSLDGDAVRAAITPRTRAIIFNTPANPTGHVATRDEVDLLAAIAREHDLVIFADEIYEDFIYNDTPHLYRRIVCQDGDDGWFFQVACDDRMARRLCACAGTDS